MKKRVAILASGGGTTAETFIRAAHIGDVDADVIVVISNNPQAGVLDRVAKLNHELGLDIHTEIISSKTHPAASGETVEHGGQTLAEQQAIIHCINDNNIDLILLLGYMKRVGSGVVQTYGWKPEYTSPYQAHMLNTHPGLLPATKGFIGINVQEHILEMGSGEAGQTLHVVSEDYDDGPIVAVNKVSVEPDDTPETLFARVQTAEKANLAHDVDEFLKAQAAYEED